MKTTSAPPRGASQFCRRGLALLALPLFASTALAAIPVIEDPGNIVPGVIELITGTEVGIQIVASDNPTSYGETNLPSGLFLNTTTGYISGDVDISAVGTTSVTLTATNADGEGTFDVDFEVFQRNPPIPPGPNIPPSGVDNNLEIGVDLVGNIAPFTQSPHNTDLGLVPDFFYRLYSGSLDYVRNWNTGPRTTTGVRTYVMGPAEVKFTWWGGIETGYDFFSFYVDEDPVPSPNPGATFHQAGHHPSNYITGTSNSSSATAEFTQILGPGLHRLEWLYTKDYDDTAGGSNQVFLDNIRITGYPIWADGHGLTALNSGYNIDREPDGNNLLMEYAFGNHPGIKNPKPMPTITFDGTGRAMLEVGGVDGNAYGASVDIEKSTLLTPGNWFTTLDDNGSTFSTVRRIEPNPETDGYYRAKVDVIPSSP